MFVIDPLMFLLGLAELELLFCNEMAPLEDRRDKNPTSFASYLVARLNSVDFLLVYSVPCVTKLLLTPAKESVERNEEFMAVVPAAQGLLPVWLREREERSLSTRDIGPI